MPRVVRLKLEKIQRDFLWGVGALEKRPHLVKWFVLIKRRAVWGLEIFLFSIGPFCVNGVGALRLKGSPFGSLLLVGSLEKKVEGEIPVRLGRAMGWGFGRKLERKVLYCLKMFPSLWGMVGG